MRRKLLLSFFAVCSLLVGYAQNITVKGKVTDESGVVIPAATISGKTSKKVLILSGSDGTFTINVPPGETLVISAVGFENKEVSPADNVSVSLRQDVRSLAEVVVTGVGVATSKKKLGIAVESITSDKLPAAPTADVGQALVGKIAGAQISSSNGSPGAPINILLRGINTLQGNTFPMIMLDGVEVRVTDLNSLDLNGIERVEVVQGAAAATIYGAQGANGVIQLFSKKGKGGKINIDISSNVSVNSLLNIGDVGKARFHSLSTNDNNEVIGGSSSTPCCLIRHTAIMKRMWCGIALTLPTTTTNPTTKT